MNQFSHLALSLFFFTVLHKQFVDCQNSDIDTAYPSAYNLSCIVEECKVNATEGLRLLMLGDWGGLPVWPYKTVQQARTAGEMAHLAERGKIDAVLALGDNFYFEGVTQSNSKRFQETFEEEYSYASLQVPWFVVAGNHDHYGEVGAQVEYSEKSKRWRFPSLYYSLKYHLVPGSTRVEILMIDTILLCGNTRMDFLLTRLWKMFTGADDTGMEDQPTAPENPEYAAKAWAWLETRLKESTADYVFVAGHFPIWSISSHGPTHCLRDKLDPMLHKYKANGYISGHDHNLQHLRVQSNDSDHFVHYIVSGLGAFSDDSTDHQEDVPQGSSQFFYPPSATFGKLGLGDGGVALMKVRPTSAQVTFFEADDDKIIHQFDIKPRKKE